MAIRHLHRHPSFWTPSIAPTEPVELDWSHPLAALGVDDFVTFGNRQNYAAPAYGVSIVGTVPRVMSRRGLAYRTPGNNTNYLTVPDHGNLATQQFTVSLLYRPISVTGNFAPIFDKGSAGTREMFMNVDTALNFDFYQYGKVGGGGINFTTGMAFGNPYEITFTRNTAGAWRAYVDGIDVGGGTNNFGVTGMPGPIAFGANISTGGQQTSADFIRWVTWQNVCLTPSQITRLVRYPFEMLRPVTRRTYAFLGNGSNAFSDSVAETGSLTDTISAIGAFNAAVAEAGALADALDASAAYAASLAEAGSATDTSSAIASFLATVTEAGALTDAPFASAAMLAAITETGNLVDHASATAALNAVVIEAGNAQDLLSATAQFTAAVIEIAVAADTISAVAHLLASVSEAGALADISSTSRNYVDGVIEAGNLADHASATAALVAAIAEAGSAQDLVSASLATLASLQEVGDAQDLATAFASFQAIVIEAGQLVDLATIVGKPFERHVMLLGSRPGPLHLQGSVATPVQLQGSRRRAIAMTGQVLSKDAQMTPDQDFTLIVGNSLTINLAVVEDNAPLDLTGATITWALAHSIEAPALVTKTIGSGVTLTDAPGGMATIEIQPADTTSLAPGRYYHEARVVDAMGDVSTVLSGHVTLLMHLIR